MAAVDDLYDDTAADDGSEDTAPDYSVRTEESTIRAVVGSRLVGKYLCCDCGKVFDGKQGGQLAKAHEAEVHLPDDTRLNSLSDDELAERWLLLYKTRGTSWEHPMIREGKKRRIVRTLSEHDYKLDRREIRQKTGLKKDEVADLLDALVEEDRVVQDGLTWGVAEEPAAITA